MHIAGWHNLHTNRRTGTGQWIKPPNRVAFLSLEDLLDSSDDSLFTATRYNPQHVLHQLLPPPKRTGYYLRSRGHSLTLSVIPSEYMRKNFVNRMLYSDIY